MLRRHVLLALIALGSFGCSSPTTDSEGTPGNVVGATGGGASTGGANVGGAGAGGVASVTGGSGSNSSPSCEGIPRDTGKTPTGDDACQVFARIKEHCGGEPSDLAECYAGSDVTRIDGCFLMLYEQERQTCEENDDWDWSLALVKANPEITTSSGLACLESRSSDCDLEIQGTFQACLDRLQECNAWDDLCAGTYVLAPAWSSQLPDCLARPCAEIEDCLYDLRGIPENARD